MIMRRRHYLLAFVLGALCNLAFGPFHFFFAAIISIGGFFILLNRAAIDNQKSFNIGWCYGFGYFVAGIYWIIISLLVEPEKFAWLIPFALILIPGFLAGYFALLAFFYQKTNQKFQLSFVKRVIVFSLLWLGIELLRSYLFSGFAWNLIGYIWLFNDDLSQLSSIFGVYGMSLFAVFISALLTQCFDLPKNPRASAICLTAIVIFLIASYCYGHFRISQLPSVSYQADKKIRIVQAAIKQEKLDRYKNLQNFNKHIELTTAKDLKNIGVIIWSESSIPYILNDNQKLISYLKSTILNEYDPILISGGLRAKFNQDDQNKLTNIFNSIFVLNHDGIIASYDKTHLVPFGEYMPFSSYLPFITKIANGEMDFSSGNRVKTIKTPNFSFIPLICYEVSFSTILSAAVRDQHPDLIINLTNDAWFGNSSGPYQHLDMAKMRAIEYGLPLIRAANTGISAIFNPLGQLIAKIDLNQEGVIDIDMLKKLNYATFYSQYDLESLMIPIVLLSIILLL